MNTGPTVEDMATALERLLGGRQGREFYVELARELLLSATAARVTREAGFAGTALAQRIERGADWDKLPKVRAARKKR